jgi:integrase
MPPHIKKREDRGGYYYLIDGDIRRSLETKKKGLAEHRLEQYIQGAFDFDPKTLIKTFYEEWINDLELKLTQSLIRKSEVGDKRQHFNAYILPEFGDRSFHDVTTPVVEKFAIKLTVGRSAKTAENIISSFRAMWKAARKAKVVKENPFELAEWPEKEDPKPDPFTEDERSQIIAYWREKDLFYYPYVAHQFMSGMRPSETAGLRAAADFDSEGGTITIRRSRDRGAENKPKTKFSARTIQISEEHVEILKLLPSHAWGLDYLFVNKEGRPMSNKWAQRYWPGCLKEIGIRYRKFYCTRHTAITIDVKAGKNLLAIAQYYGTSLQMIQRDYCGTLDLGRTISAPDPEKPLEKLERATGIEPVSLLARMRAEVQQLREFKRLEARKRA